MITVSDVLDFLEGFAPPELAESWDNVGLLCGDRRSEVTSVLCALDATETVVQEAIDRSLSLRIIRRSSHRSVVLRAMTRPAESCASPSAMIFRSSACIRTRTARSAA